MKYEDRTAMIFDFLYSQNGGLLRGYEMPSALSADRARDEINNMVEDLNSDIPSGYDRDQIEKLLVAMRPAVRRRHGSRIWPTIKILLAAQKDAFDAVGVDAARNSEAIEEAILQALIQWHQKFGRQMPAMSTSAHMTQKLIDRGILANEREARWRGYDLSPEMAKRANTQHPSADEWKAHVRITARIRGVSEDEADFQERKALGEDQTPIQVEGGF